MLVSIIIPCHNAEKYVAEAIQSALEQTHPQCEVIVIDDGSTDGSLEVIRSFGTSIKWETGPNRGGCAARNRGLMLAKGKWIQFLDADDLLDKDKLEKQVIALAGSNASSVAFCTWRHFATDAEYPIAFHDFHHKHDHGTDLLIEMWLQGHMLPPHSFLVPKSLCTQIGGWDTNLAADQDGDFFGRILCADPQLIFTPHVVAYYRKPSPINVSQAKSMNASCSRLLAFEKIARLLLERNNTKNAQIAVHRRFRETFAQAIYKMDKASTDYLISIAERYENEFSTFDHEWALRSTSNLFTMLLGIRRYRNMCQVLNLAK